jgi:hypothetical protein
MLEQIVPATNEDILNFLKAGMAVEAFERVMLGPQPTDKLN